MPDRQLPATCFVLNEVDPHTHRHYRPLYQLIERLAERAPVAVLAERGAGDPGFAHVRRFERLSWPGKLPRRLQLWGKLARLRASGYRVFYCHYTFAAARTATLLTRLAGGHTYLWHCLMSYELDAIIGGRPLHARMLGWTLRWVDRLVTGTEFMAGYYGRSFGVPRAKIRIVPNFLDTAAFVPPDVSPEAARRSLGLPVDRPILLFVSGLVEGRAHRIPEVLAAIRARVPDALLVAAGDGPYRAELEARLAAAGLTEHVILAGHVENREIWRYYRAADLFLHVSRHEAFTRVLLEAMAAGVPFVATDGGGPVRDYTADFQQPFVVPSERIDLLAARAADLIEDPAARRELAERGREFVRRFDTGVVLETFIREVLRDGSDGTGA